MKLPDDNPLLNEILADEKLADARRAALEDGIRLIRRDRRQRQFTQLGALVAVMVAIAAIYFARRPTRGTVASVQPKTVAGMAKHDTAKPVKTITDEELFALFPGRAIALIGKPGHQDFVLLDSRKSE